MLAYSIDACTLLVLQIESIVSKIDLTARIFQVFWLSILCHSLLTDTLDLLHTNSAKNYLKIFWVGNFISDFNHQLLQKMRVFRKQRTLLRNICHYMYEQDSICTDANYICIYLQLILQLGNWRISLLGVVYSIWLHVSSK